MHILLVRRSCNLEACMQMKVTPLFSMQGRHSYPPRRCPPPHQQHQPVPTAPRQLTILLADQSCGNSMAIGGRKQVGEGDGGREGGKNGGEERRLKAAFSVLLLHIIRTQSAMLMQQIRFGIATTRTRGGGRVAGIRSWAHTYAADHLLAICVPSPPTIALTDFARPA